MQLHSKMRFIAAQFTRYLTDDFWETKATTANNMASLIPKLQKQYFFHVWNESPDVDGDIKEVRLMCSWDTTEKDISGFIKLIKISL